MRSQTLLSLITVIAIAGLNALATPAVNGCQAEYCHGAITPLVQRTLHPTPASQYRRHWTNAQRLARGMGPNPPTRRSSARRQDTSSSPSPIAKVTKRGVIKVELQNTESMTVIGYISKNSLNSGQFIYQTSIDDALIVEFQVNSGATSVEDTRIVMTNSDTGYPYLGFIQGRDDMDSNLQISSYNYVYFGGVAEPGTPPNSMPGTIDNSYTSATALSRTAETDVWSINLSTGQLSGQWTNSDGDVPTTYLYSQNTALYGGGDPVAFMVKYPAPIMDLNLYFVENP